MSWRHDAACRNHPNPHWWDEQLDWEQQPQRDERHRKAIAVCAGCPVRVECLTHRRDGDGGIYAGRLFGTRMQPTGRVGRPPPVVSEPVVEPCSQCGVWTVTERQWRGDPKLRRVYRPRLSGMCQHCYDKHRRPQGSRKKLWKDEVA